MITDHMKAVVLGVSLIVSSAILTFGITKAGNDYRVSSNESQRFILFSHGYVVYRLDKTTGRTDVLFPGKDGAVFLPLWQMNPAAGDTQIHWI